VGVPSGTMRDRSTLRLFAPAALAVLVMLPRLASPQFGLLDDGLTLQTGREVIGAWSNTLHLIPATGRFFPAYWLVYSAILGVVGARPLAFFTVNVVLLVGLLAGLARLVRLGGGTRLQAAVAAVLFSLWGPAIETFYTLSKATPSRKLHPLESRAASDDVDRSIQIKRRPDVIVEHVARAAPNGSSSADVFVATPEVVNQPGPTVRIALDEQSVRHDNAMLSTVLTGRVEPVYRTAHHTRLVEFGIHRLLGQVTARALVDATYCPGDRGAIDGRTLLYGWQVHRLGRPVVTPP
jgi:hypothetical protein